jgi:DNA-binding LytR/AlgR family response regulator
LKDKTENAKSEEIFHNAVVRAEDKNKDYMSFSCAGETKNIAIKDIEYFQVTNHIINVSYEANKTVEFYSTLGRISEVLGNKGFARINKFTIINLLQIENRTATTVTMRDGNTFTIGKSYRKVLKNEIARFFEGR